jgi:hypothetical protein
MTTTTASTTWNFSGQAFSPRSVVPINGHTDDGLLKVRTDLHDLNQSLSRQNARVQTYTNEQQVDMLIKNNLVCISTSTLLFFAPPYTHAYADDANGRRRHAMAVCTRRARARRTRL